MKDKKSLYQKPELKIYGNLKEHTKGTQSGGVENNSFRPSGPE
ncbi:hypothetical protein [Methanobacterium paludis]|nr:hypothetical protein [Methanobacterium paludis]